MNWYKHSQTSQKQLGKSFVGQTKDGIKVYLINGGYFRDHYDVNFTWGGHFYCGYKFIPKDEIWIERHDTDKHDEEAIIAHELKEYRDMKNKHESYHDAHADALKTEKQIRKDLPES